MSGSLRLVGLIYLVLTAFRVICVLNLHTQFDPDEYWQTLEPAYCEAFRQSSCAYTWEWTRRAATDAQQSVSFLEGSLGGPVRSYVSVFPTYLLYVAARFFRFDTPWWIAKGPLILNAIVISAPTDFCVWWTARILFSSDGVAAWALFCSVTSWFHAYALVRTYSNSMECMLLALGIALVCTVSQSSALSQNKACPELTSFPKSLKESPKHVPFDRLFAAFVLGGLSVAVRITSLASWVPLGIWLALAQPSRQAQAWFTLHPCATGGSLGLFLSILVDRLFYGFWTFPLLGNLDFNVLQGELFCQSSILASAPFIAQYRTGGIVWNTSLALVS